MRRRCTASAVLVLSLVTLAARGRAPNHHLHRVGHPFLDGLLGPPAGAAERGTTRLRAAPANATATARSAPGDFNEAPPTLAA